MLRVTRPTDRLDQVSRFESSDYPAFFGQRFDELILIVDVLAIFSEARHHHRNFAGLKDVVKRPSPAVTNDDLRFIDQLAVLVGRKEVLFDAMTAGKI